MIKATLNRILPKRKKILRTVIPRFQVSCIFGDFTVLDNDEVGEPYWPIQSEGSLINAVRHAALLNDSWKHVPRRK